MIAIEQVIARESPIILIIECDRFLLKARRAILILLYSIVVIYSSLRELTGFALAALRA